MKWHTNIVWLMLLTICVVWSGAAQPANINSVGGFESNLPSYWTMGSQPAGSTLSWATDQSHSPSHALKVTKSATSDSAAWISENMVDYWSERHFKNVDMKIGAWVKTQGVNTSPAAEDQKWTIVYAFYDSAGVKIGETKLPVDQTVATKAWYADTNAIGATILPKDAWKTIIRFVGGKNATGTVWADDFMLVGRAGGWAGQNWNTSVEMPTGWIYWLPPNGGNDGALEKGYENTVVTTEAVHSGLKALKFDLPFARVTGDGFVGTKRDLLSGLGVKAGDVLRVAVWVKGSSLVPDSAAAYPTAWAVGFTYGFFKGNGNNAGFNSVSGYPIDMQFVFPPVTAFDWTQYYIDIPVPADPEAKALEIRLHPYSRFTGTVYFDDLTVQVVGVTTGVVTGDGLPKTFELGQNYPNPFNPSTRIQYGLPHDGNISLMIYNVLGQRVRSLVNETRPAGRYEVTWDGKDDQGRSVGSGLYFYRLETGQFALVQKMLMLK
jgi:hypothetical protein